MFDLRITHSPVYGLPKPCLSLSVSSNNFFPVTTGDMIGINRDTLYFYFTLEIIVNLKLILK